MNQDIARLLRDYATILGLGKRGYRLLKKSWDGLSDVDKAKSRVGMESTLKKHAEQFHRKEVPLDVK